MLSRVFSSAVIGIEAHPVEVEVDIGNGLPDFSIVGLPDTSCRESADRVRAAIKNSGLLFPSKRITVNLAPANVRKEGSSFDVAIAIGLLAANEVIDKGSLTNKVFCGELSLDGRLRPVPGVLPRAACLLNDKETELVIPAANFREAQCVKGLKIFAAKSLSDVISYLKGEKKAVVSAGEVPLAPTGHANVCALDFSDIKGQAYAKRGLEIAAAGRHNVLMIGPPGSGKTMLAKRFAGILPGITFEEAIETTKIHSVAGTLTRKAAVVDKRPFRDPHHTISQVAMIGGGVHPRPGEVSMAHNGVLFLDELPEFPRNVLEVLRQPMEDHYVSISRASFSLSLPARFMLVAAMNPCPCGHFTDPKKECSCTPLQIKKYMARISAPLFDRIDIQLEVPCLKAEDILTKSSSEPSEQIKARVERAMAIQRVRYQGEGILSNAQLESRQVEKFCGVDAGVEQLLRKAIQELGFSARAYHKTLKVARTIADLDGQETLGSHHVAEAIQYRSLDRSRWLN